MDASCSMGASLYFMLMLHVTLDTCDQCRMNFIELTEKIFVWKTFSYPGISSVKAKNICFRENSNDGSKRLSMKAKHFVCFRKNTNDESKRAHGIFALQAIKMSLLSNVYGRQICHLWLTVMGSHLSSHVALWSQCFCKVTCQTKTIISPLPQYL